MKGIEFNLNIYRSIEDIKKDSDLIIIASYSENPIEYQEEGIDSSRYFLQVEKVLKGNIAEGDEIVFSQFGKPDNDEGETKIKKDKNIFFVVPCQIKTVVLK